MNSPSLRSPRFLAFAAACVLAWSGCSDTTGLADGTSDVQVTLQQSSAALLAQVATDVLAGAPAASAGRVPREEVASLTVTVTAIEMLPYCEEAGEQSGDGQCEDLWVALTIDGSPTLDLLALPSEDESPIVIAGGSVPVGEYHKVRIFVEDATVVFSAEQHVGQVTFDAGTEYPVEIPSADSSGIKADIDLVIEEAGEGGAEDVALLFDADATFQNVVATGNGRVLMPPVIKARSMHQNQNG